MPGNNLQMTSNRMYPRIAARRVHGICKWSIPVEHIWIKHKTSQLHCSLICVQSGRGPLLLDVSRVSVLVKVIVH